MSKLSYGKDLGPVKVPGMRAAHHCEISINGQIVGKIYAGNVAGETLYEYRGRPVGAHELEWVAARDRRDVIGRLEESLAEADRLRRSEQEGEDSPDVDAIAS